MSLSQTSRSNYEKRIRSLTQELEKARADLHVYRVCCVNIYDALASCKQGELVSPNFMLQQFRRLWRWS